MICGARGSRARRARRARATRERTRQRERTRSVSCSRGLWVNRRRARALFRVRAQITKDNRTAHVGVLAPPQVRARPAPTRFEPCPRLENGKGGVGCVCVCAARDAAIRWDRGGSARARERRALSIAIKGEKARGCLEADSPERCAIILEDVGAWVCAPRPLSGTPWLARSRPKFAAVVLSDPIYSPAVVTRPARPRIPICRRARIASRATRAPRADTPPCATPAPSTAFAIRKMRARPRREEVCVEDSERAAGDSEGVDREAKGTMSRRGVLHRTDARSLTLSRHGADALTRLLRHFAAPDVPTD